MILILKSKGMKIVSKPLKIDIEVPNGEVLIYNRVCGVLRVVNGFNGSAVKYNAKGFFRIAKGHENRFLRMIQERTDKGLLQPLELFWASIKDSATKLNRQWKAIY